MSNQNNNVLLTATKSNGMVSYKDPKGNELVVILGTPPLARLYNGGKHDEPCALHTTELDQLLKNLAIPDKLKYDARWERGEFQAPPQALSKAANKFLCLGE